MKNGQTHLKTNPQTISRKSYFKAIMDYSIFYRRPVKIDRIADELPVFDILVSAYNSSDRISKVFNEVRAKKKVWLIHPEYGYDADELPSDLASNVCPSETNEISQVNDLLSIIQDISGKNICIDITGFMRHVLVFLISKLARGGVREFTAIYSEPMTYAKHDQTSFSTITSDHVRTISGMYGGNNTKGNDFLILGVGFDHKLISEVTYYKDNAEVFPLFAFPSLSPDMYQQSAIRAAKSGAVALEHGWIVNRKFAPANDPFSTASMVSKIVGEIDRKHDNANIFLSPLSTKTQTLGFALFWQLEGIKRGNVSVLLPECLSYSRETSIGLSRLWTYTIELQTIA